MICYALLNNPLFWTTFLFSTVCFETWSYPSPFSMTLWRVSHRWQLPKAKYLKIRNPQERCSLPTNRLNCVMPTLQNKLRQQCLFITVTWHRCVYGFVPINAASGPAWAARRNRAPKSLTCSPDRSSTRLCSDLLKTLESMSVVSLFPRGTQQTRCNTITNKRQDRSWFGKEGLREIEPLTVASGSRGGWSHCTRTQEAERA